MSLTTLPFFHANLPQLPTDRIERHVAKGLLLPIGRDDIRFNREVTVLLSVLEPLNVTFVHRLGCLATVVVTVDCNGHVGANGSPNYIHINEGTYVVSFAR